LFGQVQSARRIAIYPFKDIDYSRSQQIGQKLYDRLQSKLTDSGAYQIIDRQYLERVMREQQLPTTRFDPESAVKVGKLLNVSAIVEGSISTFTVNQASSEDAGHVYGTVTVGVTARLISTETGTLLKAPSVSESAKGAIRLKAQAAPQPYCRVIPFVGRVCSPPPPQPGGGSGGETRTVEQLTDEALERCASSLADVLSGASGAVARSAASEAPRVPPMATPATVIGMDQGLVYINKGVGAGLRTGQTLQVYRAVATSLRDPDTGEPVVRKIPVCLLTLTDVEEKNSSGTCEGGAPSGGDLAEVRFH
jgi:hypothetical protein